MIHPFLINPLGVPRTPLKWVGTLLEALVQGFLYSALTPFIFISSLVKYHLEGGGVGWIVLYLIMIIVQLLLSFEKNLIFVAD